MIDLIRTNNLEFSLFWNFFSPFVVNKAQDVSVVLEYFDALRYPIDSMKTFSSIALGHYQDCVKSHRSIISVEMRWGWESSEVDEKKSSPLLGND